MTLMNKVYLQRRRKEKNSEIELFIDYQTAAVKNPNKTTGTWICISSTEASTSAREIQDTQY